MTTRLTKLQLIRKFADELVEKGDLVTHGAIREMLDRERPGHRTFPTEISHGLGKIDRKKRARQGSRIEVDGKQFPSIRSAAAAQDPPISRQAAHKRVKSGFPGWRRIT